MDRVAALPGYMIKSSVPAIPFRSAQTLLTGALWTLELFPYSLQLKGNTFGCLPPLTPPLLCDLLWSHSWKDIFSPWSLMLASPVVEPEASEKPLLSAAL